jgi:toxin ParE1/3/4
MNAAFTITDTADADLDDHFRYIAHDSPAMAARFRSAVYDALIRLAEMPGLGSPREYGNPELAGLRMWHVPGFRNHLIFYRPIEGGIEVIRALHGARDLAAIFGESEP